MKNLFSQKPAGVSRLMQAFIIAMLLSATLILGVTDVHAQCTTDAECNDGLACTSEECVPFAGCIYLVLCNDDIDCTDDVCAPTGTCLNTPNNDNCDDNAACTDFDWCNAVVGFCVYQTDVALCYDGYTCTEDTCAPFTGCTYSDLCGGTPDCAVDADCDDGNTCTDDTCDPVLGCKRTANNANCADDAFSCTIEICFPQYGGCIGFTNCDDGLSCTNDFCDFDEDECLHETVDGACDDGFSCTSEICSPFIGCIYTMLCDDGINCTDDDCVAPGVCVFIPRNANCEDGFPTTINLCSPVIGCYLTFNSIPCFDSLPCTVESIGESGCTHTPDNSLCDDGDACTDDVCSVANAGCVHPPVNCDDRNECTTDGCSNFVGCRHARKDCSDGNECTADECDPLTGNCVYRPADGSPSVDAGADQDVFPAYLPAACASLTASGSGGAPPLSYSWSNGAATASISVCPAVTATYCVTVTDATGCPATDCVTVCARNISCGTQKVNICHRNTNGTFNTLCVATSAVPAHLAHGDALGSCGLPPCADAAKTNTDSEQILNLQEIESVNMQAYPNPFSDRLNIEFSLTKASRVKLEVFSVSGQQLATLFDGEVKAAELQTFEYNPVAGCGCMIIYRLQTEQGTYYGKAVMAG